MGDAPSCRFCYESQLMDTNPLFTPCACRGSVAYVHIQCLLKWRAMTVNPDFVRACEVCKQMFAFPLRWPINVIHTPPLWKLLSNSPLIVAIAYYIHFCVMMMYPQLSVNLCYWFICCGFASLYGLLYAYSHIIPLHEKRVYITYWIRHDIYVGKYNPLSLMIYTTVSFLCLPWCYYPMGALFLYFLPLYNDMHASILHKMNTDAEIFPIQN